MKCLAQEIEPNKALDADARKEMKKYGAISGMVIGGTAGYYGGARWTFVPISILGAGSGFYGARLLYDRMRESHNNSYHQVHLLSNFS